MGKFYTDGDHVKVRSRRGPSSGRRNRQPEAALLAMAKMIIADLTPEEAAKIQEMINTILEELHNREMSLDPTLFAERMAAAINAGERSFERIKALTLGPEAAPAQRAN